MRHLLEVTSSHPNSPGFCAGKIQRAIEAFADEYCERVDGWEHCGPDDCKHFRAALLKECGLEP
jgi:hypothetical protein